ncbi:MAG: hypothetical protein ACOZHQ_08315 [Thermodesulfobacteriota bacterium]
MPAQPERQAAEKPGRLRRWLPWLLLLAALLRLGLGAGLFLASPGGGDQARLEALAQRLAAPDAVVYHGDGEKIYQFYRDGKVRHLPPELNMQRFGLLLAGLYALATPHPLVAVGFNALCALALGWLAYGLARRLGQPPGRASGLALLLCLWPPSLAWAALPLKEPLGLMLCLAHLYCLTALLDGAERERRRGLLLGLGYLASVAGLAFLRFYLGYFAILAALAALAASLPPGREPTAPRPGWGQRALVLGLAVAVFIVCRPLHHDFAIYFLPGHSLPLARPEGALTAPAPVAPPAAPAGSAGSAPAPAMTPEPAVIADPGLMDKARHYQRRFLEEAGRSLSPGAGQGGLLAGLGRALRDLLLFPHPWQRWPETPAWGLVNLAVAGTALVWWLMLPGLALGAWRLGRGRPAPVLTVLFWALMGVALALVVVNRGTLYRLRDLFLLPGLLLWLPAAYPRLGRWTGKNPKAAGPPGR